MKPTILRGLAAAFFLSALSLTAQSRLTVSTNEQLEQALEGVAAGTTVLIAPGVYRREHWGGGAGALRGSASQPIEFRALDPANPPEIRGSIHVNGGTYVTFRAIVSSHPTYHNFNVADVVEAPGVRRPGSHISFEDVTFRGTRQAAPVSLKLTRQNDIVVRNCRFYGWGDNAIDTIGVHRGVIEDNVFEGLSGHRQRVALQLKGGTRDLIVRNNYFENAGDRVIQAGGGTGERYFRSPGVPYEAENIEAYNNVIVGGLACFVFASQRGSRFHHNICYKPKVFIARFLNESPGRPVADALVESNLFWYGSLNYDFINVGIGVRGQSQFRWRDNAWYQTPETRVETWPKFHQMPHSGDVVLTSDPLTAHGTPQMRIASSDPRLGGIGPTTNPGPDPTPQPPPVPEPDPEPSPEPEPPQPEPTPEPPAQPFSSRRLSGSFDFCLPGPRFSRAPKARDSYSLRIEWPTGVEGPAAFEFSTPAISLNDESLPFLAPTPFVGPTAAGAAPQVIRLGGWLWFVAWAANGACGAEPCGVMAAVDQPNATAHFFWMDNGMPRGCLDYDPRIQ